MPKRRPPEASPGSPLKKARDVEPSPPPRPAPLSKYERVRVIGSRASQLAKGARPLVQMIGVLDPLLVAEEEFRLGLLNSTIVRTMPDGEKERHTLAELRQP